MKIKEKYKIAKEAKVGEVCICPSCGTKFIKTNYQQAFCKSRSGTKCKDKYWNLVTPEKKCNTTRISPASLSYVASQDVIREARQNIKEESYYGTFKGKYTSEGYKMFIKSDGTYTAVDEYDEPVYDGIIGIDDPGDSEYWDHKDF